MSAPTAGGRWTFETRRHGYERTCDLFLMPEPSGLAVLCDYDEDELLDGEAIQVYLRYLDRKIGGDLDRIPIHWFIDGGDGGGICEVAPHQEHDVFSDGRNFLTYFTTPIDAETGAPCSFYRLPIQHRFPIFWEQFGYQPAPLQPYLPLLTILRGHP